MKHNHTKGIAVGVAALAAGVAGAYYLYGSKNAPSNRRHIKSWMLKMKAEVMDEIEKVQDLSESTYKSIVDQVGQKYQNVADIDPSEVTDLLDKMKGHWEDIKNDLAEAADTASDTKDAVKKIVKKATK